MYPYYVARAIGGSLFLLDSWLLQHLDDHQRACRRDGTSGTNLSPSASARGIDDAVRTHYRLERNSMAMVIGIIIAASIGGLVEIAPLFTIDETVETDPNMRLYTPLELAGRNIYIREGCYACHSQMIRTLQDEVERYGPYSLAVGRNTITRCCGARSAPGRTSRASAANIPTSGRLPI